MSESRHQCSKLICFTVEFCKLLGAMGTDLCNWRSRLLCLLVLSVECHQLSGETHARDWQTITRR